MCVGARIDAAWWLQLETAWPMRISVNRFRPASRDGHVAMAVCSESRLGFKTLSHKASNAERERESGIAFVLINILLLF